MKKRIMTLSVIFLVIACVFCGCSPPTAASDVAASELFVALPGSFADIESVTLSLGDEKFNEYFEYLYNIPISAVSDGAICYATQGGLADEVSVLLAKESNVAALKSALEQRVERRIRDFTGYSPEEVAKLENALIFTCESFAVLVVCAEPEPVRDSIIKTIKGNE